MKGHHEETAGESDEWRRFVEAQRLNTVWVEFFRKKIMSTLFILVFLRNKCANYSCKFFIIIIWLQAKWQCLYRHLDSLIFVVSLIQCSRCKAQVQVHTFTTYTHTLTQHMHKAGWTYTHLPLASGSGDTAFWVWRSWSRWGGGRGAPCAAWETGGHWEQQRVRARTRLGGQVGADGGMLTRT